MKLVEYLGEFRLASYSQVIKITMFLIMRNIDAEDIWHRSILTFLSMQCSLAEKISRPHICWSLFAFHLVESEYS